MRATKGLMHGSFFYRYGSDQSWLSSSGYISPQIGSLLHFTGSKSVHDALVADLRTCRVTAILGQLSEQIFLRLQVRGTHQEVHFCPRDIWYFNAWFAAFLTWQSIPPHSLTPNHHTPKRLRLLSGFANARQSGKASSSDSQTLRQETLLLLEPSYSPTATSVEEVDDEPPLSHAKLPRDVKRIRTLCLLRGPGILSLYHGSRSKLLATIQIKELSRSAIQRVDYSIFHSNYVIVIRPRCSTSSSLGSRIAPLYLSCPTRESLETWIVIMQTLAVPDIYGSQALLFDNEVCSRAETSQPESASQSMMRLKPALSVRINKVRLFLASKRSSKSGETFGRYTKYYLEILIDHQLYIVTHGQALVTDRLHFLENHTIQDVPPQFSTVVIRLRKHEPTRSVPSVEIQSSSHELAGSFDSLKLQRDRYLEDAHCGEVVLESGHLKQLEQTEQTLPLSHKGESVGELVFAVEHEDEVIMMAPEYEQVLELFEKIPVPLSLAFSEKVRPLELPMLAERLLNVFLVSGKANKWLIALAEKEILRTLVNTPEQKSSAAPANPRSSLEQAAATSSQIVSPMRQLLFDATLSYSPPSDRSKY